MAMDLLRLIAASPLPAISYVQEEITAIKALRSAGLLVALTPAAGVSPSPEARECAIILAITDKGRQALRDFPFRTPSATPQSGQPMSPGISCPRVAVQPQAGNTKEQLTETIDYKGMSIEIKVQAEADRVSGRADVCAGTQFKGRLALGNSQRRPDEVLERMRCLAKAKIDAWSVTDGGLDAGGQQRYKSPDDQRRTGPCR